MYSQYSRLSIGNTQLITAYSTFTCFDVLRQNIHMFITILPALLVPKSQCMKYFVLYGCLMMASVANRDLQNMNYKHQFLDKTESSRYNSEIWLHLVKSVIFTITTGPITLTRTWSVNISYKIDHQVAFPLPSHRAINAAISALQRHHKS